MDTIKSWFSSSLFLEDVEAELATPETVDAASLRDPADYMTKMNEIASPNERLQILFKSIFMPHKEPTLEAGYIRLSSLVGFVSGAFYGGILTSQGVTQEYVRKHNASVFEGQYRGNRHFYDTLVSGAVPRALKYGFRCACVTTPAAAIGMSSIAYRNELYLPDWLVGFSALGGLSRLWIGSKGVAVGGLFGLGVGFFAYGLVRAYELASDQSVAQMRYVNHVLWANRREAEWRNKVRSQVDLQQKLIKGYED